MLKQQASWNIIPIGLWIWNNEEDWADIINKVAENEDDYLGFEKMTSSEAFRVMESFIDKITHISTHNKFIDAISRKKPFSRFNNLLHYYPDLQ